MFSSRANKPEQFVSFSIRISALINKKKILELEKQVWDALVSGDQAADSLLLSDDFLGVYTSGFEGKEDHSGQLASGPSIHKYHLSSVTMKTLSLEVVLISYRADYSRHPIGENNSNEVMYISSIWQNFSGRWLNIFSQDTVGRL